MKSRPLSRTVALALLPLAVAAGSAGCRMTPIIQPGPAAPASAAASIVADTGGTPVSVARPDSSGARPAAKGYVDADVRFMQGMIHHHAQALEMTALVPSRTTRDDMRLLAQRIETSQRDEIALMRRWLQDRHEAAPDPAMHAGMHHDSAGGGMAASMPGMAPMPGMLTPEQMARLAAASGPTFDRLFLEGMIQHHEGALTMVRELFATPGAGQEGEVFRLASDVEADQRAEIARMRTLLAAMPTSR